MDGAVVPGGLNNEGLDNTEWVVKVASMGVELTALGGMLGSWERKNL